MSAKVTVVTLYRGRDAEHYVGVVQGKVTKKQLKEMAKGFKLHGGDEPDCISTVEMKLCDSADDLKEVLNIHKGFFIEGKK